MDGAAAVAGAGGGIIFTAAAATPRRGCRNGRRQLSQTLGVSGGRPDGWRRRQGTPGASRGCRLALGRGSGFLGNKGARWMALYDIAFRAISWNGNLYFIIRRACWVGDEQRVTCAGLTPNTLQ